MTHLEGPISRTAPVRVLYGSPLSRPKFASFVILMLVVMVILSTSDIVNTIVAPTAAKGGIPVFLLALAWSGFLSIVPIAILWFLDRRELESKWLYAIALLWGALIADGKTNQEIVEMLYIAPGTVRVHVHAILQKLDVRDHTQAAVIAIQKNLIDQQLLFSS